jgi:hypothetical protein
VKTTDLILSLLRLSETKRAVTAFVNGAPGVGKTFLLQQLSKELPNSIRNTLVFGPYHVGSVEEFTSKLLDECRARAYIEGEIPSDYLTDLMGTFDWLKQNIQTTSRQTIIILIDLDYKIAEKDTWRSWFSSIRSLEQTWEHSSARLLVLLASNWNHNLLDDYYKEIRLSFPYTVSQNYFPWDGVSVEQIDDIVGKYFAATPNIVPFGCLLHEISGGHPGAVEDILKTIPKGEQLSIASILTAVKKAACNGKMAEELVAKWICLPAKARAVVRHLLLMRQIPATKLRPYFDGLYTVGLLKEKVVAGTVYGVLNSWYVELTARYHLKELEIEEENLSKVGLDDLTPPLVSINNEAYLIINEIENMARNFVTVQLSATKIPGKALLWNRATRYDKFHDQYLSAYERSIEWKENSRAAGLPVDLNPLIAYLSIKDLPKLIEELAKELKSDQWTRISSALDAIGDIRDAIMHNQIIDDDAFTRLFILRAAIYDALRPETALK